MSNYKISLAGNPNVGKSTIFNALTGLHQHTGNWPGKTVGNAIGRVNYNNLDYNFYDLPGTYSLISHSKEEKVARDFICFEKVDATVVVCDAVCLERNLNLVLQIMEITDNVIVVVNLLDEAFKKKIKIDFKKLEKILNTPVVGTSARSGKGLNLLMQEVEKLSLAKNKTCGYKIEYDRIIEDAIFDVKKYLDKKNLNVNTRWLALRLLTGDNEIKNSILENIGYDINSDKQLVKVLDNTLEKLKMNNYDINNLEDDIVSTIVKTSESIAFKVITFEDINYNKRDRKIDKILTSKKFGIPIMLLMLLFIFWLTIVGSNYPSNLLYNFLFSLEDYLFKLFSFMPEVLTDMLINGVYRTLAWVVSVMLPPMAIFFPLFTILEDLGGKQALTMCMGFGCNAVGVSGCRIIDSKRERLIAIITNSFVPCNGRFPTIIAIITMFFVGISSNFTNSLLSAVILILVILLGIFMTLLVSKILSKTILKGIPSSFTLELPPYRRPQIGKVIVRSIFDRTLFVLGRAIIIAAPAGLVIWMMSNITILGSSILNICTNFLNPIADVFGMDGVILMAFILGFPANEIVIPIMLMAYMGTNKIIDYESLTSLKTLLIDNGWTTLTAICVIIFSLIHFPCSTTCLTIKKETKSLKWTFLSFVIPLILGLFICFLITTITRLLALV